MRYFRKIICITAMDSPNVRLALAQQALGLEPTGEIVTPGVLTWQQYQLRRATWDVQRATVGLDAQFYEGPEILLFPPDWLNRAAQLAQSLVGQKRQAKAIGIDPAEGGDKTAMAAVDELGLIELVSKKTPDTSVITGEAIAFLRKHNVAPECVLFDRGGGGKEHADRLRLQGFNVRTVAFGETLSLEPRRGTQPFGERLEVREERYVYLNRRAQMYGELSLLLDPTAAGFALPAAYHELRRQLAPIPKLTDDEGRYRMLPKNKRRADGKEPTLTELIGCSPDEADALVLAVHGLLHPVKRAVAGAW